MKRILVETRPYILENIKYEIRIYKTNDEYIIESYRDGKRADSFTHTVKFDIKSELESKKGEDILLLLVNTAKESLRISNRIGLNKTS